MRCSGNEHVERELTALDVVGVISAVAGVTPAVIAVCRAWVRTSGEKVEREGCLPQVDRGPDRACGCGRSVIVRYELPTGGRVTVWTMPLPAPASDTREQGRGPW